MIGDNCFHSPISCKCVNAINFAALPFVIVTTNSVVRRELNSGTGLHKKSVFSSIFGMDNAEVGLQQLGDKVSDLGENSPKKVTGTVSTKVRKIGKTVVRNTKLR